MFSKVIDLVLIFGVPLCFIILLVCFLSLCLHLYSITNISQSFHEITFAPRNNNLSTAEIGLSKDVREMLPIVIFNQSFSIKDLQCVVCLEEYQANEKLQQIPACGHTFHMQCIDQWLTSHSTCPLCRLSLIPTASHQSLEIVSSTDNFSGEAFGEQESQSTSEAVSHINDGQEHIQEVSNEMEENGRNNIGTIG